MLANPVVEDREDQVDHLLQIPVSASDVLVKSLKKVACVALALACFFHRVSPEQLLVAQVPEFVPGEPQHVGEEVGFPLAHAKKVSVGNDAGVVELGARLAAFPFDG